MDGDTEVGVGGVLAWVGEEVWAGGGKVLATTFQNNANHDLEYRPLRELMTQIGLTGASHDHRHGLTKVTVFLP